MSMSLTIIFLSVIILILLFLYYLTRKELKELRNIHDELKHDYLSKSVKHGQHWEQFAPFSKEFDKIASRENFAFIGQPIDGIAFDQDSVKFIEFKTGNSNLNIRQRMIKNLIENKKVSWHELRF